MIRWIGDGLLTSQGETWLRQRRLAQPAFHRQRMMALTLRIVGEALLGSDVAAETQVVGESFQVLSEQLVTRFRALRLVRRRWYSPPSPVASASAGRKEPR